MPTDKVMKAALKLRQAVGHSRNWGIGWILKGDDEVVVACREFDIALKAKSKEG